MFIIQFLISPCMPYVHEYVSFGTSLNLENLTCPMYMCIIQFVTMPFSVVHLFRTDHN